MPRIKPSAASARRCTANERERRIQAAIRRYDDPNNDLNPTQIAHDEGIAVSTMHSRIKTRRTAIDNANSMQKLSPEQEAVLCQVIDIAGRRYMPMPPSNIHWQAQVFLRQGTGNPDASLSRNWPAAFKKRNSRLLRRWNEVGVPGASLPLSHTTLADYFDRLQTTIDDLSIPLVNIYSMDETGFRLDEESQQLIHTDRVTSARAQHLRVPEQNDVTAIEVCRNSVHDPLPMPGFLVVNAEERLLQEVMPKRGRDDENRRIVRTQQGSGFRQTMLDWLQQFIDRTARTKGRKILLLDGYSSHRLPEMTQLAELHGIVLFSMPPSATSLLQPLDIGVLFHLKEDYNRIIRDSEVTSKQPRFPLADFIVQYSGMRRQGMTPQTIMNGFKRCGITPTGLRPSNVLQKLSDPPRTPSPATATPTGSQLSSALQEVPDAPRTPSRPTSTPSTPPIFTPKHATIMMSMLDTLPDSTPETSRRKCAKLVKAIDEMEDEIHEYKVALEAGD